MNVEASVQSRTDNGITTTYTYEKLDGNGLPIVGGATPEEYRTTTQLPLLSGTGSADRRRIESYDLQRRLIRTINPGQTTAAETRAYDQAGFLAYAQNELGQRTTYQNDSRGNVRLMWDPLERPTSYAYTSPSSPDLVTKRTNPTGLYEEWTFDANRNQLTYRDSAGITTTNTYYTSNGFLLDTVSSPTSGVTKYTYSPQKDLATELSPRGLLTSYTYDGVGRIKTVSSGTTGIPALFGVSTVDTYDLAGRIKKTIGPAVTNEVTNEVTRLQTEFGYSANFNGNLMNTTATTLTGATGTTVSARTPVRTVTNTYDTFDRIKSTSNGFSTSYTDYDAASGMVSTTTDASGRVTRYEEFFGRGAVKRTSLTAGGVARNVSIVQQLDALGRPTQATDFLGRVINTDFAADGQVARVQMTFGGVTYLVSQSTFDTAGRIVGSYADNGLSETVTAYKPTTGQIDSVKRVMSGFGPDFSGADRATSFTYVASGLGAGQVFTSTDPSGAVSTYAYGLGGVVSSVSAPGGLVSFTHDERSLRTGTTDVTGAVTTQKYDLLGRHVATTSPAVPLNGTATNVNPVVKIGFNPFGDSIDNLNERAIKTTSEFNAYGQLKKINYPAYTPPSGGGAINPTELFDYYSGSGLLQKSTARNGSFTTFTYEPFADRIAKTTYADGQFTNHTYNDAANSMTSESGSGTTVLQTSTSQMDAYDRTVSNILSATGEVSRTTSSQYDGAGRVLVSVDAMGFEYRNGYNRNGELIEGTEPGGTASVTNTYDVLGRIDLSVDALGRQSKTNYKPDQRLDSVQQRSAAGTVMESMSYTYDIPGRKTTMVSLRGDTSVEFRDAIGRTIKSEQILTLSPAASMFTSYGYDQVGNLTRLTNGNAKVTTYTYNPWNLQQTLVEPGSEPVADRTWTTSYDSAGNPKTDVEPGPVTTTRGFDSMNRLTTVTGTDPDSERAERFKGVQLRCLRPLGNLWNAVWPTFRRLYRVW
jgi:large repetitive protein